MHIIVEASTKSVNSHKNQYERKCRKLKRAKCIRAYILRELKEEIRKVQAVDVIVVGYFNEDSHSKNMQELMVETGLQYALSESHDVDKTRYGSLECGSKYAGIMLVSKVMLEVA